MAEKQQGPARALFSRVMVGFDGSQRARDALSLGKALTADHGELIICCVHRLRGPSARVDVTGPHLDRADAERLSVEAARLLGPEPVSRALLVGGLGAGETLCRAAVEQHADLLVLGSSHHGAAGRVLLGSVTEEALHAAPCPVAVAPVGLHDQAAGVRIAQIAVGYDVTAPAQDALQTAATLASQLGGELRVVAVADTAAAIAGGANVGMSYPAIVKARLDAGERGVAQALATLPQDISASSEVRDGEAAEKLLEVSHGVDLLVLGSRGRGPVRRLILGSVCDALVRSAACPVLVIPPHTAS